MFWTVYVCFYFWLFQIDIAGIIKTNAIILLVVGVVLLGFGILGACGAKKMHQTMLKIVSILVWNGGNVVEVVNINIYKYLH